MPSDLLSPTRLDPSTFEEQARRFLSERAARRPATSRDFGAGPDTVPLISDASQDEEAASIKAAREWRRVLFDHGFGWIDGPPEYGGAGLSPTEAARFREIEAEYEVPDQDCFLVGLYIVAPAITAHGTPGQKEKYLKGLFRGDLFACQLFSEPGHGSDLAGIATRAEPDGDEWVINGQKVWNSFAQHSDVGLLLARTDPSAPKHQGLTMYLLDMDQAGVDVRPLRQMTGGAHFNEVFISDGRVPDSQRLGGAGDGWRVAITTLMSEREAVGAGREIPPGDLVDRLVQLHRHTEATSPAEGALRRAEIAEVAVLGRVLELTNQRMIQAAAGHPGPEMSVTKLLRNHFLAALADTACRVAGPASVADTGSWGRYSWGRARLSLPGLRIAGGTDEIQRNILGERVLGLPREPAPLNTQGGTT
jgi:acyl-CoA dehydrogenase